MAIEDISLVPLAGCRREKLGDSSSQSKTRHDMCVIHPNECPYEFVNPLDIDIIVDHPSCNSVSSTPIGHCGNVLLGGKRDCAVTKDACRSPDSFVAPSQSMSQYVNSNSGCTILQDLNYNGNDLRKGGGLTRYIGCEGGNISGDLAIDKANRKGKICVATVPECRELAWDDVSITLSDPECDCSETRVGACFRMGDVVSDKEFGFNYFCAVSSEVCDTDMGLTYQDVNDLMRYSDIDCRLCDARVVKEHKIAVSKASDLSTGVVVGIAVASALGSALLVTLLHRLCFRVRKGSANRNQAFAGKALEDNTTAPSFTLENDDSIVINNNELNLQGNGDPSDNNEEVKVHDATFS